MRIGIKYCGGCNPRYDRVAAVKELQHAHLKAAKHKFVINSREQLAAACEAIIKENEV